LAVAAQRQRRSLEVCGSTSADGVITGLATINADRLGAR
jgi:hypothetical protein